MKLSFLLLLCLLNLGCQQAENEKPIAFDRDKWCTPSGPDYPYRDLMIDDLMQSDTIKRLNKADILDLLGSPDRIDNNYLFYMIVQQRAGLFPLHTKTMVIKMRNDAAVEWVKIHE